MAAWIAKQAAAAQAWAGNAAGGAVNQVGNGVTAAGTNLGNNISNTTRGWGDSTKEYGNSIKDVTGAKGARAATGQNPLGLSKGPASYRSLPQQAPGRAKVGGSARDPLGLNK